MKQSTIEFRKQLEALPREKLLELVEAQDPDFITEINRIEYVFANKLNHLTWPDGTPITGRPVTNEELALLIDEPFEPNPDLLAAGISIKDQQKMHVNSDTVMWARKYLNVRPRAYQIFIMRHPSIRKVLRAGRRLGKTFSMAVIMLHYAYTHKDGRCLVVAPMKPQVGLIYEEIMKRIDGTIVQESIARNVTSPQYEIRFTNGATIKFFTSGMRSGGKADVARGQEAHIILLDEMDYMHPDDLDALYVMLQRTDESQEPKTLIAASTPTGRKEKFYDWCVKSDRFREFWYPSYVHPLFDRDLEEDLRAEYEGMAFRHEVEADWGEDVAGVYPPNLVDPQFNPPFIEPWAYTPSSYSKNEDSFTLMGVDWDKYGAGVNIVVLEVCGRHYSNVHLRNKIRVLHREEVRKDEYTLTEGTKRVIKLNEMFNPKWIYCDRGYGEVQVELLHQHGVQHPETGLKKKVKGIAFNESIDVRDPATMQMGKKETKEFMVSTLRELLEERVIYFSNLDDLLYQQLTNYVVERITPLGKAVFSVPGKIGDHAHDALILACLAYNQNYSHLLKVEMAKKPFIISSDVFTPLADVETQDEKESFEDTWGSRSAGPAKIQRQMTTSSDAGSNSTVEDRIQKFYTKKRYRPIKRKSF